jgi:predicted nucleic acid-binding protein
VDVEGLLPEEDRPIEGVIDTGIIVIAHFENPAREEAFQFLREALTWRRRCLIPTTAIVGAYHIMTRYLGVDEASACKALTRTLETRSPALYEDLTIDAALDALTYAIAYKIESWDGYLIHIAKTHRAPVIYSVDQELSKKMREIPIVNPIPRDIFINYNRWLRERLEGRI